MSLKIRGKSDKFLDAFMKTLAKYEAQHPRAQIEAYRQGRFSIRIRIIDPDFSGVALAERHDAVWQHLDELPEEALSHLSILLLLTPKEKKKSFANMEFENPIPSEV